MQSFALAVKVRVVPKTFHSQFRLVASCTDINVRSVKAGSSISLDKLLRHRSTVQTDVHCPFEFVRNVDQKDDIAVSRVPHFHVSQAG